MEGQVIQALIVLKSSLLSYRIISKFNKGIKPTYGRYSAVDTSDGEKKIGGEKSIWMTPISPKLYWFIMEIPNLLLGLMVFRQDLEPTDPHAIIPGMFLFHYFLRVFIYGMNIRGGRANPLVSLVIAFIFTTINSYFQVRYHSLYAVYPENYISGLQFKAGIAIFFMGMIANHHSDTILRNLRKDDNDKNHYIPRGGLFEYVSGANFFAESIEWLGYSIAANSIVAFMFFIMTAVNTGVRASEHHDWYIEKFKEEYPRDRKRFIPFVW